MGPILKNLPKIHLWCELLTTWGFYRGVPRVFQNEYDTNRLMTTVAVNFFLGPPLAIYRRLYGIGLIYKHVLKIHGLGELDETWGKYRGVPRAPSKRI